MSLKAFYNASVADDIAEDDPYVDAPGFFSSPAGSTEAFVAAPAQDVLWPLYPYEGPVARSFTITLVARQHEDNAVYNDRSKLPVARVTVALVTANVSAVAATTTRLSHLQPVSLLAGGPGGPVVSQLTAVINASREWHQLNFTFGLPGACLDCRVAVSFDYDGWISYWGSQMFFGNVEFTQLAVTRATSTTHHVSEHEVVTLPVMPPAANLSVDTRQNCPHLESGLVLLDTLGPFASGDNLTLPDNTRVLVQGCSLPVGTVLDQVVVPATSALIFDDADMTFAAQNILVYGELLAGAPECRLVASLTIELHGTRESTSGTLQGRSKGLVAMGGRIDLHGKEFDPWVRLAASVWPGQDRLVLQEPVNWERGQRVAVMPTNWRDLPDYQYEERTVRGLSADRRTVLLAERVNFFHYAGPEYQGEVALLSRRLVVRALADQSVPEAFGGHILVTGAGAGRGRFSGVQADRLGQKNVLGRYPIHFHLLDSAPDSFVRDCSITNSFFRAVVIHG